MSLARCPLTHITSHVPYMDALLFSFDLCTFTLVPYYFPLLPPSLSSSPQVTNLLPLLRLPPCTFFTSLLPYFFHLPPLPFYLLPVNNYDSQLPVTCPSTFALRDTTIHDLTTYTFTFTFTSTFTFTFTFTFTITCTRSRLNTHLHSHLHFRSQWWNYSFSFGCLQSPHSALRMPLSREFMVLCSLRVKRPQYSTAVFQQGPPPWCQDPRGSQRTVEDIEIANH